MEKQKNQEIFFISENIVYHYIDFYNIMLMQDINWESIIKEICKGKPLSHFMSSSTYFHCAITAESYTSQMP